MIDQADLKKLTAPFPRDVVGVKVQSVSKNKDKAMLVLYAQHTDVANRLDEVDPSWTYVIIEERFTERSVVVRATLTVKGVARSNVGEGEDAKSAASDAFKRCASMFGVGRYLYDQSKVLVPYDEARDRFRVWTMDDVEGKPKTGASSAPRAPIPPVPAGEIPPCEACGKPLKLNAKDAKYFCSNYRAPLPPGSIPHVSFPANELQTYRAYLEEKRKGTPEPSFAQTEMDPIK